MGNDSDDDLKDEMNDRRFTAMEAKIDQLLKGVERIIVLEERHTQTQRDVNAAHELLRSHATLHQALQQQAARTEQILAEIPRLMLIITDTDTGLSVRLTKVESVLDANRNALRMMGGLWISVIIGTLGTIGAWVWTRIAGP